MLRVDESGNVTLSKVSQSQKDALIGGPENSQVYRWELDWWILGVGGRGRGNWFV